MASPDADAGLLRRIEQLEEQLVDLQVTIGTLESLARGAGPPSGGPRAGLGPSAAVSAADAGRLDAIETQITALASQLEGLQQQVRELAGRSGFNPPADDDEPPPTFGSVTVAPGNQRDDIDRVLGAPPPQGGPPPRVGIAPPGSQPDMPPQQLYEQAYGYLLQKDYASAESGFESFLRRHPGHQLAGNAQYWLGETFYVRGQYRPAAAAFLKGYQSYARSPKAPECLLKLAMSLQRLGQKNAACSSFNELATKFPNPPAHVRSIAQTERQRSGCT
jgi:tol-pal system protein YbgF